MTEDTRRDWAVPGIIFGLPGRQIIICSTLDGVPYFPDDVPIPPVGQDDELQPEYNIVLAEGKGVEREYSSLGGFGNKDAFDIFAEILGYTMKAMTGGETKWEPVPHKVEYTDIGPVKVEDNGVYLPLEDGYEYQMFRKPE